MGTDLEYYEYVQLLEIFRNSLQLLGIKDKAYFFGNFCVNLVLSLLELFSIAILSLFFSGLLNPEFSISGYRTFHYGYFNFEIREIHFIGFILIFIVLKSLSSILLYKFFFKRLEKFAKSVNRLLLNQIFDQDLQLIMRKDPQEITFIVNNGINAIYIEMYGNLIIFVTECLLLISIIVWLSTINLLLTISIIGYFILIFFMIQIRSAKKLIAISKERAQADIHILKAITETLLLIRELRVSRNIGNQKVSLIEILGQNVANSLRNAWINVIPKYIFDSALILGLFLFSTIALHRNTYSNSSYFILLSISMAKMIPSLMKIQNSLAIMRQSIGVATFSANFIRLNLPQLKESAHHDSVITENGNLKRSVHKPLAICFNDVNFQYFGSDRRILSDLNFSITGPGIIGIVGPSGSGKSTLAEIILGLNKPSSGSLSFKISDTEIEYQPVIEYVSQNAPLYNGTIRDNLIRHSSIKEMPEEQLIEVLSRVGLLDLVNADPHGLDLDIGIGGNLISGGERQRLCLARVFLIKPDILVLDEPTSALDIKNVRLIFNLLRSMRDSTTVIVISHETENLDVFDKLLFMDDSGPLLGTHEGLHRNSENFRKFCNCGDFVSLPSVKEC